jgi:uncharacterized membrane protein
MAGIGFRLREMAEKKTFIQWLKLYTFSAVIFAGPWLISIVTLALISAFAIPLMGHEELRVFIVNIVYIYFLSLVTTGVLHLTLSRYVSDQIYMHNSQAIGQVFVGAVALTCAVETIIGALGLFMADLDLFYKFCILGLYVTVCIIWVEMVFLSALKDYLGIVGAFAIGYALSFALGQMLGMSFGLGGLALGFLCGQVLLMGYLMYRVLDEFGIEGGFHVDFLRYLRRYPSLALAGVAYNLAIWIDKVAYWHSPSGIRVQSYFYTHFPYDSAMFIAFLTIIPTLAIFLLRVETDFFWKYKAYYGAIVHRAPFKEILQRKDEMRSVLVSAFKTSLIYQGGITTLAFILMPFLLMLAGIDPALVKVFRVGVVGAFFHGYFLILIILLLYYDFRGVVLFLSTSFLICNAGFSILAIYLGDDFAGFGYLFACAIQCLIGFLMFSNRFRNLEYLTFMRQPVG